MKLLHRIPVPTGDICIVQGDLGRLECLSIGDYGKDVNLKADFMGLEREPSPVKHTKLLPLSEKWVVTISTQYGCDSGCTFCDVPRVGKGTNATLRDLIGQVLTALALHPEVRESERLNIHYARMGEPSWNPCVLDSAETFHHILQPAFMVHPVVSTMMPKANTELENFLQEWMRIKNEQYAGNAGLQLSINSTDDAARAKMFNGSAHDLKDIAIIADQFIPKGRKITLNFALGDWDINAKRLKELFDPERFLVKLTPLHVTQRVDRRSMMPAGDWTQYTPYADTEKALRDEGFDVIVFIASHEEDNSRITCGNALLAHRQYKNTP